jgi:hypothetical protein
MRIEIKENQQLFKNSDRVIIKNASEFRGILICIIGDVSFRLI